MLTIREFHGKDEEDNKIEEKIRNDIKQMLTESNTINDEADKDFINTLQNIPQQYGLTLSKLRGWLHHGLKRLKRKTANMLAHYERFVYSRSFRSNPPRSPIDGI